MKKKIKSQYVKCKYSKDNICIFWTNEESDINCNGGLKGQDNCKKLKIIK